MYDGQQTNGALGLMNHGSDMSIFDPAALGKRLRGARTMAGFASPEEVNRELEREFGITYSPRGMLAIERGDQRITFEQFVTLALLYDPPGGMGFFIGAVDPEYLPRFQQVFGLSS